MALKKSDLYSSLWASCDQLRGGMDASQYKDYILTLLFVKYVSDKAKANRNSLIDVPEGGSFDDFIRFKGDKEIGDKINKAIGKLAEANDLQKVIDLADFNDEEKLGKGKEMQDRLTNLVGIFQGLEFGASGAAGDDLLGDAYEYLMRHFAAESGKSKGQFYTPAEVSRVMAQLLEIPATAQQDTTVYDPTCGSGSLLLKVADESPHGLSIYGQEKDNATWALAKMNMILHGNEIADIRKGDTITSPQFTTEDRLDTFDYLVANPPFSIKSWSNGLEKDYGRFELGTPPPKNGDYAFLLHMLKSLKSTGKGAVILPHGVLFRGNAEAAIRKEIVRRGYIKAIVGLPANLFYGTGIPACILVINKEDALARTAILMVDASKGFAKDGPKNRLRSRDMHKIIDAVRNRVEIPGYSRLVPLSEIEGDTNAYNLNIPRYIDSSETEDIEDLEAHIHGGIPNRDLDELGAYWKAFPGLRATLFGPLREGYSQLIVDRSNVNATITGSLEVRALKQRVADDVATWWASHATALEGISSSTTPHELLENLSESLLEGFRGQAVVDEYAVYEKFVSYWQSTMHDDVALIMTDGWDHAGIPRRAIEDKDGKLSETPDIVVGSGRSAVKYKADLLPPDLITDRFFAPERQALDALIARSSATAQSIEDFVEENSTEDGPFFEAIDDGKITKAWAVARLRSAKGEGIDPDEIAALTRLIDLYSNETEAKKAVKDASTQLEIAILGQYNRVPTEDIRDLVITHKWGAEVSNGISSELEALIQKVSDRIATLADRYDATVADIEANAATLGDRLNQHLEAMGIAR